MPGRGNSGTGGGQRMIMPMAEPPTTIREMNHDDVSMVSDIERRSYEFPWSHGVFRDCLLAGYQNIVLVRDKEIAGYGVLSVAAGFSLGSLIFTILYIVKVEPIVSGFIFFLSSIGSSGLFFFIFFKFFRGKPRGYWRFLMRKYGAGGSKR